MSLFLLGIVNLSAHPHFNKRVRALLPGGIQAVVSYRTIPFKEMPLEELSVGDFASPRGPRLTLTNEVMAGSSKLVPGTYTIGVLKREQNDWSMVLTEGRILQNIDPDRSRFIHLESEFSRTKQVADHMEISIIPGSGRFKGMAVIIMHFGQNLLKGAFSYPDSDVAPPDRTEGSYHGHP